MISKFLEASGCNLHFLDFVLSNVDNLTERQKFLDIGCGTGVFAHSLAAVTGLEAFGTELSEYAVKIASTRIRCSQVINLKLPFDEKCFDLVVAKDVIPMIHDKSFWFFEINRVLKNGGYFISYLPDRLDFFEKPLYSYIPKGLDASLAAYDNVENIISLMELNGFEVEEKRILLGTVEMNFEYAEKHRCGFFSNTDIQSLDEERGVGISKFIAGLQSLAEIGIRPHYEWERTAIIGRKK